MSLLRHSAEFKAKALVACDEPGASISAVALANGQNANPVPQWHAGRGAKLATMADVQRGGRQAFEARVREVSPMSSTGPEFVAIELPVALKAIAAPGREEAAAVAVPEPVIPGHSLPVTRAEMESRVARYGQRAPNLGAFPDLKDQGGKRSVSYLLSPGNLGGPAPIGQSHNFHLSVSELSKGIRPNVHSHPYNEVFRTRLAHRDGRSSQTTPAAVDRHRLHREPLRYIEPFHSHASVIVHDHAVHDR